MHINCPGLIVIGGSAGAYDVVVQILEQLPPNFRPPIVIVLHRNSKIHTQIEHRLAQRLQLSIEVAKDKQRIEQNHVYFAPPGHHLLVEPNGSFALDVSEPVSYSRPSIDVVFESAADVYQNKLTLLLLSGANTDGAKGIAHAAKYGATCLVQNPSEAAMPTMPAAAIKWCDKASPLRIEEIVDYFTHINLHNDEKH